MDAHLHLWDLPLLSERKYPDSSTGVLYQNFLLPTAEREMAHTPVRGAIFVQTVNSSMNEARWAIEICRQPGSILKGVVAGLDFTEVSKLKAQVAKLKATGYLVGCRHILDFEEPGYLLKDSFQQGLALLQEENMPFDLLLRPHLLADALELVRRFPTEKFIVDHIAKPTIRNGSSPGWAEGLKKLSEFENVYVKLSGLVTEAKLDSWTIADLQPYVQHAVDCFGVERCMFGSDWPVCKLANADYHVVYKTLRSVLSYLDEAELQKIFEQNCRIFYNLPN